MAEGPFSNAGLNMFGAEKSFTGSAMNTRFQSPLVGLLLGKALGGLSDDETVQDLAKQLIASGAVKPPTSPTPAAPQGVAPRVGPAPTTPMTAPLVTAPSATTAPVVSGQANPDAVVTLPSLVDFLPKQFMPR